MSHFAHHAGRRFAEVEADFAHARYIVVPALLWVVAIAAGLAASATGAAPATGAGPRLDAALEQYEQGHYQAAFDGFAALADDGHCEAARIARQMVRLGRHLYPIAFQVEPARLQRWQSVPACPTPSSAQR